VTKLLAKMPIQEIEPEPSYIEAKVVVLIVMVVAGLGLAGGYIIFPLLQVQATEPVITVDNLTNNTTESHTPTSTHTKKYTTTQQRQFKKLFKIPQHPSQQTHETKIEIHLLINLEPIVTPRKGN
jgi:hypothetical protein